MSRDKLFLIVGLLLLPKIGYSQSLAEFKNHIKLSLHKIEAMYDSSRSQPFFDSAKGKMSYRRPIGKYHDSLDNENAEFRKYLMETLPHLPESLTSPVPHYEDNPWFAGVASKDAKFRDWSWNTWMGGTMPIIFKLIEYRTAKGIKVFDPIDTINEGGAYGQGWCDSVYTVQPKKGSAIYLPVERYKSDTRNWGEGISAFRISDTLERDIPLFQDTSGFISGLSWSNEPTMAPNDAPFVITVSDQGRTILLPYLDEVGWKHKLYAFDGEHFIYKGIIR